MPFGGISTVQFLGGLDILVNNVAYQNPVEDFTQLSDEQWRRTFAVNIDSFFHVTKAALAHLPGGGPSSHRLHQRLAWQSDAHRLLATKGAVIALTYSLAQSLNERGIRVDCQTPGPV